MRRWTGAALLILGCGGAPTELIVVIETNLDVPSELDAVELIVTGPESRIVESDSLVGDGAPSFPLTIGVRPSDAADLTVDVVARGLLGADERVRTAARVTLVSGESRTLHLVLLRGCIRRDCGIESTCGPGGCRPLELADLPEWTGSPPVYTEVDPCDGMTWDADMDMAGSIACGGADCDDDDASRFPDAIDTCDGVDSDCDGEDATEECPCTVNGETRPCTNTCGTIGEQTCTDGAFGPCETLVESCSGQDDDCDGKTDEGFDYAPTGELRITTDDADSQRPRVSFATDSWGIVWRDDIEIEGDRSDGAYFVELERDGGPRSALRQIVNEADDSIRLDLAWNGSVYGVVWLEIDRRSVCCPATCPAGPLDCTSTDRHLTAAVFDASGNRLAGSTRLRGNVDTTRARVVWDGSAFAVAYRNGDYELIRFDEAAAILEPGHVGFDPGNRSDADFTWSGTHYALAWAQGDRVYFLHDVTPTFALPSVTVAETKNTEGASLDALPEGYLVSWYEEVEEDGPFRDNVAIQVAFLDQTGARVMPPSNLSLTVAGRDFDSRDPPAEPSVRTAPGQTLVTWADQRDGDLEIYFARLAPNGEIIQPATRMTNAVGESDFSSVAWDGTQFGVAWVDERDGNREVYFNRLRCSSPP